jgi:hypothetical protein
MMEVIHFSETSVLTRATRRRTQEASILLDSFTFADFERTLGVGDGGRQTLDIKHRSEIGHER